MSAGLSLVIPVHNDTARLKTLLAQAEALGIFAQVIVVDDGSDRPVRRALGPMTGVEIHRLECQSGAGAARNLGLEHVRHSHVLFFDSDDSLLAPIAQAWADLQSAPETDVLLFKYAQSDVVRAGHWGQPDYDERFWQAAGTAFGRMCSPAPAHLPLLAQTANYPWNKIIRTAFLRREEITFMSLPVHNDLSFHWHVMTRAQHLATTDRICAYHRIGHAPDRLTARRGAARFAVFDALAQAHSLLPAKATARGGAWHAAFDAFCVGLLAWARARVDDEDHAKFDAAHEALREARREALRATLHAAHTPSG